MPDDRGHDELDRLMPAAYDELRRIARRELRRRPDDTLRTTALVHEAYLKLADADGAVWRDRPHFLAIASVAMRRILVDQARERCAVKRGGGRRAVTLDDDGIAVDEQAESLLALDEALTRLAATEPRLAHVVECRFFGGLSEEETAASLGVTARTVRRDWVKARGLLHRALRG
ncbi:RNA polymerase sigma factor [Gemmatirosa kalamazoonensis]|uniref:RNA polymerase sigma factor n=2 Tax=Gemmatirosa kalamazoonensis TaxID=861299 RepID=W0RDB1_9BACT|nr:RNA polymerase sigma factor [Gemmatirosa kalamazoonensis]